MVLCVCRIVSKGIQSTEGEEEEPIEEEEGIEEPIKSSTTSDKSSPYAIIELTDGWYAIEAVLDLHLTHLLQRGYLYVGLKLRISNSVMVNNNNGMAPLEADINNIFLYDTLYASPTPSSTRPRLQLHYNGVRRCVWNARLGFTRYNHLSVGLDSIKENGGIIPECKVVVIKTYEMLYVETIKDKEEKKVVYRHEKEENEVKKEYEKQMEALTNKIIEKKEKEFYKEHSFETQSFSQELHTPGSSPTKFNRYQQQKLLEREKEYLKLKEAMEREIQQEVQEQCELAHLPYARDVRRLYTIQVKPFIEIDDYYKRKYAYLYNTYAPLDPTTESDSPGLTYNKDMSYTIKIWNPSDELVSTLKAKSVLSVTSLMARYKKYNTIYLNTTQSTTWKQLYTSIDKYESIVMERQNEFDQLCYQYYYHLYQYDPSIISLFVLNGKKPGYEFSSVGVVLYVSPRIEVSAESSRQTEDQALSHYAYDLFVIDESGECLSIRIPESSFVCYVSLHFSCLF